MSYAHETCCAHLKIQYCKESLGGPTHDWWECASCKMLFAPQGRTSLPQWIPISERLPTREDADERGYVLWAHRDGAVGVWLWDARETTAAAWAPVPPYTPPKPGPTDDECDAIYTYVEYIARQGKDEVRIQLRRWFADVTARIEKEKGK